MIKVLYFAWVRERIGVPYEMLETQAVTVMELVDIINQCVLPPGVVILLCGETASIASQSFTYTNIRENNT